MQPNKSSEFLCSFYNLINTFELKEDLKSDNLDKQIDQDADEVQNLLNCVNDPDLEEYPPVKILAMYIVKNYLCTNYSYGKILVHLFLNIENFINLLNGIDGEKVKFLPKIPDLNFTAAKIIKPRRKLNNMGKIKAGMPFNFAVVFTIKGLVDQNLDYISVRSLYYKNFVFDAFLTKIMLSLS